MSIPILAQNHAENNPARLAGSLRRAMHDHPENFPPDNLAEIMAAFDDLNTAGELDAAGLALADAWQRLDAPARQQVADLVRKLVDIELERIDNDIYKLRFK